MSITPVCALLGRRLRLAVIGRSPGSFIGAMHRHAASLENRYERVVAALSSNSEKSLPGSHELKMAADRIYASGLPPIASERLRLYGADVIAIMTPR
jgi:hypothetical protein